MWPAVRKKLCQLHDVGLFGDHDGRAQNFGVLLRFAGLPSVRKIYGHHVTDVAMDNERFPHDNPCALIEEIHLECSDICFDTFSEILLHIKALKVFYYDQRPDPDRRRDPSPLILLHEYASASLESLTFVRTEPIFRCGPLSFHDFSRLKHIAIDFYFLANSGKQIMQFKRNRFSAAEESPKCDPLQLVNLLPQTLEILELYSPDDTVDFTRMFEGFVQGKEERLPHLKSVTVSKGSIVNQDVRKELGELGVKLRFVDGPSGRWSCSGSPCDI
ncbi:MAG: hypothetical protein Q9168_003219 [Polycauliona sp. 1 TL-2023]